MAPTGEAQDFSESQIVRDAVSRRMEVLNDMFMTTMMTYLQQVTAVGDATIAGVCCRQRPAYTLLYVCCSHVRR